MAEKTLTLKFTLTETGISTEIHGSRGPVWVDVLKHVMPSVYSSLAEEGCDLEQTQEKLMKAMADISGKSVDDVKKDLAAMDGDKYVNIAKLSAVYLQDFIGKKFNPKSKDVEESKDVEATEKDK